jgi:hypothetical protein
MSTIKVDKIVPFQSSSVEIEGAIVVGGATTGSNDFVGNQTVTGSIDITGEFLVNGSPITGSGGDPIDTASFATTGSNTFDGSQSLTAGVLTVSSGSVGGNRQSSLSPTGLTIVDPTSGIGQAKNIILSANPSPLGGPLAAWTQPTLYGIGSAGPYQIAEFQSQGNFTDGTATFKVPLIVSGGIVVTGDITAPNLTGSAAIDTSSFATTGSNTFEGDQTVNGFVLQNISAPAADTQTDFVSVSGVEINGVPYDYTNFSIYNYASVGGGVFEDAFAFESYSDNISYEYGAELKFNGVGLDAVVFASGSASGGKISVLDKHDETTEAILEADSVIVGKSTAEGASTTTLNGNVKLEVVSTLSSGQEGQVAISGSAMFIYLNSQWNEVAFV